MNVFFLLSVCLLSRNVLYPTSSTFPKLKPLAACICVLTEVTKLSSASPTTAKSDSSREDNIHTYNDNLKPSLLKAYQECTVGKSDPHSVTAGPGTVLLVMCEYVLVCTSSQLCPVSFS